MQDFDTLRNRVEETAQKLTSAQSERQEQTETLIGTLRALEEKYAAQEQQVAYYRDRVEPLEQANEQLSLLMGNLLDLIDTGFGEDSLAPMRRASDMASAMLATDLAVDTASVAEDDAPEVTEDDAPEIAEDDALRTDAEMEQPVSVEPEDEISAEGDSGPGAEIETDLEQLQEAAGEIESQAGIDEETTGEAEIDVDPQPEASADEESVGLSPDDILDLIETEAGASDPAEDTVSQADAPQEDEIVGPSSVVTDFEMEEEPLARLEEDIDPAAEELPQPDELADDLPVTAELDKAEAVSQENGAPAEPQESAAITIDEIVGDAETAENVAPTDLDEGAGFEDVSAATLEFEQEEDMAVGMDDLPEIVQIAARAAQNPESAIEAAAESSVDQDVHTASADESVSMADEVAGSASVGAEEAEAETASDEAEAIAAIAQAIEEETEAENAPPPAPADIRSLLLRVEALAKKAEAMRIAQGETIETEQAAEGGTETESAKTAADDGKKQAGAAA